MPKPRKVATLPHPECSVCRYMNRHPDFRAQITESSYFVKDAPESMPDVMRRWNNPFIPVTMYYHLKKHMVVNEVVLRQTQEQAEKANIPLDVIEAEVVSDTYHERGLDEFIKKGRELLATGKMPLNAATYLKAIQLKLDAEGKTKDRRLDAFKMMSGAYKGKQTPNEQTTDPRTPSGA